MNHITITILFWISFILGTILGFYLLIWWVKRIWKKLNNSINKGTQNNPTIDINTIGIKSIIYSSPGLILMIICFIPSIFFNGLIQREDYCISIINVNKGIQKNDAFIIERCSCLDVNELFVRAKLENEK